MAEGAGGGALRAESRITPPKIQGGAAEVNTPASFPTLSHNFLFADFAGAASDEHRHVVHLLRAFTRVADDRRLSASTRALMADPANECLYSAASVWEIAIKNGLPKRSLGIPAVDFRREVEAAGFRPLPVLPAHAAEVESLPHLHEDPFDRLLLAQARAEDCLFLTADAILPTNKNSVRWNNWDSGTAS